MCLVICLKLELRAGRGIQKLRKKQKWEVNHGSNGWLVGRYVGTEFRRYAKFWRREALDTFLQADSLRDQNRVLREALAFCGSLALEELAFAKVGTGAEVALRHIERKSRETLARALKMGEEE